MNGEQYNQALIAFSDAERIIITLNKIRADKRDPFLNDQEKAEVLSEQLSKFGLTIYEP